jgi:hypothetical protein
VVARLQWWVGIAFFVNATGALFGALVYVALTVIDLPRAWTILAAVAVAVFAQAGLLHKLYRDGEFQDSRR